MNNSTALLKILKNIKPVTPEDNDDLYAQYKSGLIGAREEMIKRNMRMAYNIAGHFLRNHPNYNRLLDDVISEALVGLVKGINAIEVKEVADPTGYVANCIRKQLLDFVYGCDAIKTPRSEKPLVVLTLTNRDCSCQSPPERVDIKDAIEACCKTQREHDIVQLRAQSYTYKEITDELQVESRAIRKCLTTVRQRYIDLSARLLQS